MDSGRCQAMPNNLLIELPRKSYETGDLTVLVSFERASPTELLWHATESEIDVAWSQKKPRGDRSLADPAGN